MFKKLLELVSSLGVFQMYAIHCGYAPRNLLDGLNFVNINAKSQINEQSR